MSCKPLEGEVAHLLFKEGACSGRGCRIWQERVSGRGSLQLPRSRRRGAPGRRWTSQERSFLGPRDERPAAHSPGATETEFGIKELSVKMQQEGYERFYFCFLSHFQLPSSLVSILKTWRDNFRFYLSGKVIVKTRSVHIYL